MPPVRARSCPGQDIAAVSEAEQGRIRNQALGFVYQFHHLLPEFTRAGERRDAAVDQAPVRSESGKRGGRDARAGRPVASANATPRVSCPAANVSARRWRAALVTRPACLLADEPTGNLDRHTAEGVLELMLQLNRNLGTSLVIVTHDHSVAAKMDRVLRLDDGLLHPVGRDA